MSRPRLLLIHGFLSGPSVWDRVTRQLNGVADVVTPNLPGYGQAGWREHPSAYGLDAIVDHMAAVAAREEPTHVVGHSMGAIVALALAARDPDRFAGVGLIGLPVFESPGEGLAHQRDRGLLFRAWLRSETVAHAGCRALHTTRWAWSPLKTWYAPLIPRPVLVEAMHHSRAGHGAALERVVFAGRVPELASLAGPNVSVLHGEGDRAAPLERAKAVAAANGWDFTVARGGMHQVMVRRPRRTARWVRERLLGPLSPPRTP
jgi:pimeloyl-ACP methyl ester carboxylesterase